MNPVQGRWASSKCKVLIGLHSCVLQSHIGKINICFIWQSQLLQAPMDTKFTIRAFWYSQDAWREWPGESYTYGTVIYTSAAHLADNGFNFYTINNIASSEAVNCVSRLIWILNFEMFEFFPHFAFPPFFFSFLYLLYEYIWYNFLFFQFSNQQRHCSCLPE